MTKIVSEESPRPSIFQISSRAVKVEACTYHGNNIVFMLLHADSDHYMTIFEMNLHSFHEH